MSTQVPLVLSLLSSSCSKAVFSALWVMESCCWVCVVPAHELGEEDGQKALLCSKLLIQPPRNQDGAKASMNQVLAAALELGGEREPKFCVCFPPFPSQCYSSSFPSESSELISPLGGTEYEGEGRI